MDLPRKRELMPYLLQLAKNLNLPILYVSHSLGEILQLADSMLVLDKGKVLVNDHLQAVWDSAEMRPWLPAKEQSSLLMPTVTALNEGYRMSKLSFTDGSFLPVGQWLAFTCEQ